MTVHDIFARFQRLRLWSNNGRRAPNKPLLALWAIGRCLAGEPRMAPFALVDRELGKLLRSFGPPRKAVHTEYPFWRMRNDGVWEVDSTRKVAITKSGDARRPSLLEHNVHGGLLQEDYFAFRAHRIIAWEVADMLIEEHFPDSYRDDILRATGFVGGAGELWQRLRGVDAGERTGAFRGFRGKGRCRVRTIPTAQAASRIPPRSAQGVQRSMCRMWAGYPHGRCAGCG